MAHQWVATRASIPSFPHVMESLLATRIGVPTSAPIPIKGILQALCQGVIFAQAARYWECPLPVNDTLRMKSYVLTLVGLSLWVVMFREVVA